MHNRNISPDIHAYTILVDELVKEEYIKEAAHVIEIMIWRGQYFDVVENNGWILFAMKNWWNISTAWNHEEKGEINWDF